MSLEAEITTGNELAPLEQIRKIETEITGQIAAARMSAGRSVNIACSEAVRQKQQAREAGKQDGQALYAQRLAEAEDEGRALVTEARARAEHLRRSGQARMAEAVDRVVAFILGLDDRPEETGS